MKSFLSSCLSVLGVLAFLYVGIAQVVWEFRNPKANKTTLLTEFVNVVTWQKLRKYQ